MWCDHARRRRGTRCARAIRQQLGDEPISLGDALHFDGRGFDRVLDALESLRELIDGLGIAALLSELQVAAREPERRDEADRQAHDDEPLKLHHFTHRYLAVAGTSVD